MSDRKYEAFVFDLYGTLVDIRTNEEKPVLWKMLSEWYASLGAHYSPAELKRSYLRMVACAARQAQEAGEMKYGKEFWGEPDLTVVFQDLFQDKGVTCSREKAAMTANFFRVLSREKLKVYDGVKGTLERLREAGRQVYLLSNAQSDFTGPELEFLGLTNYFDGILISSEEGCRKPSPMFFRRLLERYGLTAENCLMVGNDMNTDVGGASSVGMDALYIHTETSPELTIEPRADYVVLDGDWNRVSEILLTAAGLNMPGYQA